MGRLSRRAVIGAAGAGALAGPGAAGDPALDACRAWLAAQGRARDLELAWSRVEAAGRASPARARVVEARLSGLFGVCDGLLARLPELAAANPAGVAAKLAVLAELVAVEDHPEAHGLILSLRRDLAAL